jgi:hypothetical protein
MATFVLDVRLPHTFMHTRNAVKPFRLRQYWVLVLFGAVRGSSLFIRCIIQSGMYPAVTPMGTGLQTVPIDPSTLTTNPLLSTSVNWFRNATLISDQGVVGPNLGLNPTLVRTSLRFAGQIESLNQAN